MANETVVVKLVGGEEVNMYLDSVCLQDQIFVRMGKHLIAGIVQDPTWQGIYIWQEVNGVYVRLGDIYFKEDEDDRLVAWKIYCWTHNSVGFEQKAAKHLAEQAKTCASNGSTGNHIEMLSQAPGVE